VDLSRPQRHGRTLRPGGETRAASVRSGRRRARRAAGALHGRGTARACIGSSRTCAPLIVDHETSPCQQIADELGKAKSTISHQLDDALTARRTPSRTTTTNDTLANALRADAYSDRQRSARSSRNATELSTDTALTCTTHVFRAAPRSDRCKASIQMGASCDVPLPTPPHLMLPIAQNSAGL
jgi:hypothetical protein